MQLITLQGHTSNVLCGSFSPDGVRALTGSHHETKIWDAATGALLILFEGHEAAVCGHTFSPTNAVVLTSADDGTAKVWDATTGAIQYAFGDVSVAVFAPDGNRVLIGLVNGWTVMWNAAIGALLVSVQGHRSNIEVVAFSPDGTRYLTSAGGETKIWHSASCDLQVTLQCSMRSHRTYSFSGAAFSPDGRLVLAHSRIWAV